MSITRERQFRTQFGRDENACVETAQTSRVADDEVNLIDYLRVIYKHRWMITIITVVAMASVVAFTVLQPRVYQANTSIVPPIDSLMQGRGGLAGKLGGGSSMLLQGMLNEGNLSELYVGILESRVVADALVDRFDLMHVYEKVKSRTHALDILKGNTSVKASKEGIVNITVSDHDAQLAASLAKAYVEELDKQNKRLSGGQATSKRLFLETRLMEIRAELSQIENLQSREVQAKEMLFDMLNRECEIAKMEEAKSMPTIQVLDVAMAPEKPQGRGTVRKSVLAGISALMLGSFIALGREYAKAVRRTT